MSKPDLSLAGGSAVRDCAPDAGRRERSLAGELRDTELAISFWHQKAAEFGGLPPLSAFDFSRIICYAWSYRFVICADAVLGELSFLIYGSSFAKLLELPKEPIADMPIARQLQQRYLPIFDKGCRDAVAQGTPIRLNGVLVEYGQIEMYRAAFMPLAMRQNSSIQLVFGTFNRRIGPKAHSSDAVRTTYNWLFSDNQ
jgi:hypothetical protein